MIDTYLVIESSEFTASAGDYFGDDDGYRRFQTWMVDRPDSGQTIHGAAPLRKVRWEDRGRGKGKRGGLRIIYLHVPDLAVLYMLDIYDKDEADDLSPAEKKQLSALAKRLVDGLRERRRLGNL